MPWKGKRPMDLKMEFMARLHRGERMTDLCVEYEISRKTIPQPTRIRWTPAPEPAGRGPAYGKIEFPSEICLQSRLEAAH